MCSSCHIHPPLTFPLSDKVQAMLFHFHIQFSYHPVNAVIQHQRASLGFDLLPADRALHFPFHPLIDAVGAEAVCAVQSDCLWNAAQGHPSQHAHTVKQKHTEYRELLDEYFVQGKGLESPKPLWPLQESHTNSTPPCQRSGQLYKSVNGVTVSHSKSETDKIH